MEGPSEQSRLDVAGGHGTLPLGRWSPEDRHRGGASSDALSENGGESLWTSSDSDVSGVEDESSTPGRSQSSGRIDQFLQRHRFFFSNLQLSIVVGLAIALGGMPSYAPFTNWWFFGQNTHVVEAAGLHVSAYGSNHKAPEATANCTTHAVTCSPHDFEKMYNIAPDCSTPELVRWNSSLSDWAPLAHKNDLWCGYIPAKYKETWPLVGQFIVFSVARSTGKTVQQSLEGLVGTLGAVLNNWLMWRLVLVPELARMRPDAFPHFGQAILIFWTLGVIFLLLFSGAPLNTKKFGMSWTITFVLAILNPATDWRNSCHWLCNGYGYVVVGTFTIGALISILTTIVPFPLLSISRVFADVEDVVKAIDQIWEEATRYFLHREDPGAVWRIRKRTKELWARQTKVKASFDASWWECFDLCGMRRIRQIIWGCLKAMADVRDVMCPVIGDFLSPKCADGCDACHLEFVKELGCEVEGLRAAASGMMRSCVASCMDGSIDEAERARLRHHLAMVASRQRALLEKYQSLGAARQLEFSEPTVFAFFLSYWARRVSDHTKRALVHGKARPLGERCWRDCANACRTVPEIFRTLLPFRENMDKETKEECFKSALQNFIPIAVVFLVSACVPTTHVHTRYDATMAVTLAVLISPAERVETEKDVHNFLAVALGGVMPIIMEGFWTFLDCGTWARLVTQFAGISTFVSCCLYVSYSSPQWDDLARSLVGLAVPRLFAICHEDLDFAGKYKNLGSLCLALAIHVIVGKFVRMRSPSNLLCLELRQLHSELVAGFRAFFSGDLRKMSECAEHASKRLATCRARAPHCDPKLEIAPLLAMPFKFELAQIGLKQLQLIASDLDMLIIALQGSGIAEEEDTHRPQEEISPGDSDSEDDSPARLAVTPIECSTQQDLQIFFDDNFFALAKLRDEYLGPMEEVLAAFVAVLEQRSESPCPPEHMQALAGLGATPSLSSPENSLSPDRLRQRFLKPQHFVQEIQQKDVYGELTGEWCARLAVCVQAVADANIRLHHIKEACLQEDIF